MGEVYLFIVHVVFITVNADVQLTQFHIRDDYSVHDCTQLLSCGNRKILENQRKSDCALQALQTGADIIMYDGSNKSCLLCQHTGDNFTAVDASLLIYVKGLERITLSCIKYFAHHS